MKTTITKNVTSDANVKSEVKYGQNSFMNRFNEAMQVENLKNISMRWENLESISWSLGSSNSCTREQYIVDKLMSSLIKKARDSRNEFDITSTSWTEANKEVEALQAEKKTYNAFKTKNDIIKSLKDGYHQRDNNGNVVASHVFAMCILDGAFRLVVGEPQRDKKLAESNPFQKIVHDFNGMNESEDDYAMWLTDTKVDPIGYHSKNGRFFKFVVTKKTAKKEVSGVKLVYVDVDKFDKNDVLFNDWITLSGAGEKKASL